MKSNNNSDYHCRYYDIHNSDDNLLSIRESFKTEAFIFFQVDLKFQKVYKEHYEQVKSYVNDVKLAVMIVVDSREVTRKKNPDMVKDCYDFKINDQDGVITAIFVIQVSDKPPSKRK